LNAVINRNTAASIRGYAKRASRPLAGNGGQFHALNSRKTDHEYWIVERSTQSYAVFSEAIGTVGKK
jgi:hypothetical protein